MYPNFVITGLTPEKLECEVCKRTYSGENRLTVIKIAYKDSKTPLFIPEEDKFIYHVKNIDEEKLKRKTKEYQEHLELLDEKIESRKFLIDDIENNFDLKCNRVGLTLCKCQFAFFIVGFIELKSKKNKGKELIAVVGQQVREEFIDKTKEEASLK